MTSRRMDCAASACQADVAARPDGLHVGFLQVPDHLREGGLLDDPAPQGLHAGLGREPWTW